LSDFYRLGAALAVKRARKVPVAFVAFDLLWDGDLLIDRPWSELGQALSALDLPSRGVPIATVYGWERIPDLSLPAPLGVEESSSRTHGAATCPGSAPTIGAR
jgi:hypothetical protein